MYEPSGSMPYPERPFKLERVLLGRPSRPGTV
jgi:hypothetical protein